MLSFPNQLPCPRRIHSGQWKSIAITSVCEQSVNYLASQVINLFSSSQRTSNTYGQLVTCPDVPTQSAIETTSWHSNSVVPLLSFPNRNTAARSALLQPPATQGPTKAVSERGSVRGHGLAAGGSSKFVSLDSRCQPKQAK